MNIDPMAPRTPYEVSPKRYSVSHQMATTAFDLPNFHVTQTLGVVRGIVVRSRNVFATLGATFQQIVGVRYDTTEIATGTTEVLCYGTAVIVEPTDSSYRG